MARYTALASITVAGHDVPSGVGFDAAPEIGDAFVAAGKARLESQPPAAPMPAPIDQPKRAVVVPGDKAHKA